MGISFVDLHTMFPCACVSAYKLACEICLLPADIQTEWINNSLTLLVGWTLEHSKDIVLDLVKEIWCPCVCVGGGFFHCNTNMFGLSPWRDGLSWWGRWVCAARHCVAETGCPWTSPALPPRTASCYLGLAEGGTRTIRCRLGSPGGHSNTVLYCSVL